MDMDISIMDHYEFVFGWILSIHNWIFTIPMWWKDLNFAGKLPFARDRVVESYFWIVGVYFEPEYSLARKLLAKIFSMTSIIDDIYDVYATPKELDLFTAAIDRFE
ncbi:hypothetical protein CUMW_046980 [Citrus unshiu]|nr:hypothetical protein CUMW_046980 [Citrus unshiu]